MSLVLEVGCGGRLPAGRVGVDIVKRVGDDKPFVFGEANKLPYDSGTVDVIHCSHVVEHLTPKYFTEALSEWNRVLKSKGEVLIQCPNAEVYIRELLEFYKDGGMPRKDRSDDFRGRPFELWPVINVTGLASMGDHMVNRNLFSLNHLKFYVEMYGGFEIIKAEVRRTRQSSGIEHREDGDLFVHGRKP